MLYSREPGAEGETVMGRRKGSRFVPLDAVTCEYVQATRRGVCIRTPLENVTHFSAEDKCVTAYTKSSGGFTLGIPLWEIQTVLMHLATSVHRSHLVMNHMLRGIKRYRPLRSDQWAFEILATERYGDRLATVCHTIPVSRRLTQQVNKVWREANA